MVTDKPEEPIFVVTDKPEEPISKDLVNVNLTGVFLAKIQREGSQDYFCFNQKKSFLIELEQEGTSVKGRFLSGITGKLEGNIDRDKVKFTFYTARCAADSRGEWTVSSDGASLEGYGWRHIKWRLQKTR